MGEVLDCVVIGGGPAGLTAAIYLARFRRTVEVLDRGASRAQWIPKSRNLPGFPDGVAGEAFLAAAADQARRYGARISTADVRAARRSEAGFEIETRTGVRRARTLLFATGVVERMPTWPAMVEGVRSGRIRICPICDGYEASGLRIGVIGLDAHAAREALFLTAYSPRVHLLLAGPEADAGGHEEMLRRRGVEIRRVAPAALELLAGGGARISSGAEDLEFDVVYSAFGVRPQSDLAAGLGAELAEDGRLKVGDRQETTAEGVWAAGDVVRGLNQICVATGEAAVAATAIHNRLTPPSDPS